MHQFFLLTRTDITGDSGVPTGSSLGGLFSTQDLALAAIRKAAESDAEEMDEEVVWSTSGFSCEVSGTLYQVFPMTPDHQFNDDQWVFTG